MSLKLCCLVFHAMSIPNLQEVLGAFAPLLFKEDVVSKNVTNI